MPTTRALAATESCTSRRRNVVNDEPAGWKGTPETGDNIPLSLSVFLRAIALGEMISNFILLANRLGVTVLLSELECHVLVKLWRLKSTTLHALFGNRYIAVPFQQKKKKNFLYYPSQKCLHVLLKWRLVHKTLSNTLRFKGLFVWNSSRPAVSLNGLSQLLSKWQNVRSNQNTEEKWEQFAHLQFLHNKSVFCVLQHSKICIIFCRTTPGRQGRLTKMCLVFSRQCKGQSVIKATPRNGAVDF